MKQTALLLSLLALMLTCYSFAPSLAQEPPKLSEEQLADIRRGELPEASLPCAPAECEWWEQLRKVTRKVRSGGDPTRLTELIAQAKEKSYSIPVPDFGPSFLRRFEPQYSQIARANRISGNIGLDVELRADGFVGEVTPKNSLGYGLDENSVEAAGHIVFVPAVKDRQFVTVTKRVEMTFNIY